MNKYHLIISFFLLVHICIDAQSRYPGQQQDKMTIQDKIPMKAYAFDLNDIRLLDSPFKENMERESQWILSLDVKRILHSFRTNAGIYDGNEGGYFVIKKLGGWESLDCELRGHSTGHILSGLALLYASTGNEIYRVKADSIVKGLAEVQEVLNEDGYLSAFPQQLINRNISGQPVWAPWYTLHKLFAGLIDQYLYCNDTTALGIAKKMAGWAYRKLQQVTPDEHIKMIRNEFGGINDAFYNLYAVTGNSEDKWLAEFFYHGEVLDPLLKQEDILPGKHANTYIPKLIGLTRDYELEGNSPYKTITEFFWQTVVDHHTYCTGSNSDKEKFFTADDISHHLTGYTGESCNVYNMLKLTRHLFCIDAEEKYAEYYEKALYNHILGQQDPATGMIAYFLPMLPGAHKVYSTPDSSFWCCVGTGFENQAKYGEAIYYHSDNGLYVNLFIPSELTWKEKGIHIKEETRFPENGNILLTLSAEKPVVMPLYIRYPEWATSRVVLKVNGKEMRVKEKSGSYIIIDRKWSNQDKVEISFLMSLHFVQANDNPNIAAIAYGPIILAGEMGSEDMIKPAPFSNPKLYNDYYTYNYRVPKDITNELALDRNKIGDYIVRSKSNNLTFKVLNQGIILKPLYEIHHERYIVYWNLK